MIYPPPKLPGKIYPSNCLYDLPPQGRFTPQIICTIYPSNHLYNLPPPDHPILSKISNAHNIMLCFTKVFSAKDQWFVENTLEHLRVYFKFSCSWHFNSKLDLKVKILTFVFISSQIWKGHKWIRRSKIISELNNINMVYGLCENQNIFIWGQTEENYVYFFGS